MDDFDAPEPPKSRHSERSRIVGRVRQMLSGRTARTASWMTLHKFVKLLNALVIGIWLTRHLGPEQYGVYAYVYALVLAFEPLATFGLSSFVTKEIKLNPGREGDILGTVLTIRLLGATIGALFAVVVAMNSSLIAQDVVALTAVMAFASICGVFYFLEFFFLAKGKTSVFVKYNIAALLAFSVAKAVAMLQGAGLHTMVNIAAAEIACVGVIGLLGYARAGGKLRAWRFDRALARVYVRRSLPLIASGLSGAVYLKLGVILVAELRGPEEAAIYAVAARLSEIWFILPPIIAAAAFPRLLELRRDDHARYLRRLQLLFDGLVACATVVAVGMTIIAGPAVLLLFGEKYAAASDVLVVHVWCCLFHFQRILLGKWFIAEDLYRLSLWNNFLGAIAAVSLSLALIPSYGAVGASIAILAALAIASIGGLLFHARSRPIALMMVKSLLWPLRLPQLIADLRR